MADFCKQCSEEMFGKDFRDLAELMNKEEYTEGFGAAALCEGCGDIVVDYNGVCVCDWCEKHGERKS